MTIPNDLHALHVAYAVGDYDAGAQMYAFYPSAVGIFPVLPKDIEIMPDTDPGTFGLAWYLGENADGLPRFAVRDDIKLTTKIAWHESGHALEEVIVRRRMAQFGGDYAAQEDFVRGAYWLWRGFPRTWHDALDTAMGIGLNTGGGWSFLPGESVAESISAAVGGYVQSEWTATYSKDLALAPGNIYDPSGGGMSARVFWLAQMREVDMDEATVKRISDQSAQEAVERYAVAARDTGFEPIKEAFNKHGHLDVTGTHRITGIPIVE